MTPTDKTHTLEAAVRKFVTQGCHISIGGFTLNRNPMAAVHEIIRQEIKGLHLYAHSNGQGLDELTGAGAVDRLDIAYSGNGRYAPTCINFKRVVKENRLRVEDYTNFQMALRFQAGAMGLPFLPTYSSLGTDIIEKWGFDPALREEDDTLPVQKLAVMDNPFSRTSPKEKIVAVPAINPDVTIIHAQTADVKGTVRINGLTFSDVEQAKAARHLIVTCETLVDEGVLNRSPQNNQIPGFCVDAVVHCPMGAYPTACYGQYDYDPGFLDWYRENAGDRAGFAAYIKDCILDTKTHGQFIKKMSGNRLESLMADPETGYSLKVKR
ncbi:MAG: CoA transferase subunit A [Desulfobacterales bacterium]|nr:CoA transferase subunit A [Desulfobacterales bacterium]